MNFGDREARKLPDKAAVTMLKKMARAMLAKIGAPIEFVSKDGCIAFVRGGPVDCLVMAHATLDALMETTDGMRKEGEETYSYRDSGRSMEQMAVDIFTDMIRAAKDNK